MPDYSVILFDLFIRVKTSTITPPRLLAYHVLVRGEFLQNPRSNTLNIIITIYCPPLHCFPAGAGLISETSWGEEEVRRGL